MVDVGPWLFLGSIGHFLSNDINEVELHFPPIAFAEGDNSLAGSMNGLVLSDYYVISWLPFESSLASDNIIWHHFLSTKFF